MTKIPFRTNKPVLTDAVHKISQESMIKFGKQEEIKY